MYSTSITSNGSGCGQVPGFSCGAAPTYKATGLGGKVFAGVDLGSRALLEMGYHAMPATNGSANAVSLQFGFRF